MPLGGPLHTAALKTIDPFFKHGLFYGPHMGHMWIFILPQYQNGVPFVRKWHTQERCES